MKLLDRVREILTKDVGGVQKHTFDYEKKFHAVCIAIDERLTQIKCKCGCDKFNELPAVEKVEEKKGLVDEKAVETVVEDVPVAPEVSPAQEEVPQETPAEPEVEKPWTPEVEEKPKGRSRSRSRTKK